MERSFEPDSDESDKVSGGTDITALHECVRIYLQGLCAFDKMPVDERQAIMAALHDIGRIFGRYPALVAWMRTRMDAPEGRFAGEGSVAESAVLRDVEALMRDGTAFHYAALSSIFKELSPPVEAEWN